MSTTLKVLSAKKVIASHQITQGEMLVIEARDKSNYQLIDNQTGLGPQNIIAKREGKDLKLFLEDGDMSADVVIKGYYGDENSEEVSNLIVGQHENGGIYAYVPESGLKSDAVSMLAEEVAAPQALGGEDLASAFWAFNPWWLLALVPLAAGIAIAASNGGSSGGGNENTDNTADKPTLDAKTDGSVTVKPGADNTKVVVKYTDENGNEKTATLTKDANGNWTSDNPDVAPKGDGSFTIPADKVKDGSKVTAIGTDDKGNTADADATTAGNNPDTTADKPTLTPETDGSVSVKPGEDNTKVVVKYTDEDGTEKTATLTKDADGNWTSDNPDVTPKNDGTFTIPTDKVKDSSEVTAIGTDDKGNTADADATTAGNNPDTTADKPTLTPETDGSVSVKPGEDNTKVVVKYTDEDGTEKTATLTKDADGNWTSDNPDVTPKNDGTFTIPTDKVKDSSEVTAIGTDDKGNTADADATTAGNNPDTTADKPTLTPETDGSVSVKPGEDNTKVVVKYTDEDGTEKTATLTKDADGNWTSDNPDVTPKNDGTFTIPTDKVKDSSEVTAIGTDDKGNTADADATTAGNNPDTTADKPTLTPETDGSVSVKPGEDNTKVVVKYTDEDGTEKTATLTKDADGNWTSDNPDVTPKNDGTFTIPADKVKDGSEVTAIGTDDKGNTAAADATTAGNNPDTTADKPVITAENDGSVTVKAGDDNVIMGVKFKDENDKDQTVAIKKENGEWILFFDTTGNNATVDKDSGIVTIPADKVKDGSEVTAIGTDDKGNAAAADATTAGNNPDTTADKPVITAENDGSVTVKAGDDNVIMGVKFKDENDKDQTVAIKKENGEWILFFDTTGNNATVDKDSGIVTIPADKLKDGGEVNAIGRDDLDNRADADPVNAGADPKDAGVDNTNGDGVVSTTSADEGQNVVTTVKLTNNNGNDKLAFSLPNGAAQGELSEADFDKDAITFSNGVTMNADGTLNVQAGVTEFTITTPVKADNTTEGAEKGKFTVGGVEGNEITVNDTSETPVDPADKPTITSQDNDGKVTIEPGADNNKVEIKFKDEDGNDKTVVAEKGQDGNWTVTNDDGTGATVENGKVVIPSDKVKDGEPVNATGTNTSGNTADAEAVNAGTDPKDAGVDNTNGDGVVSTTSADEGQNVVTTVKLTNNNGNESLPFSLPKGTNPGELGEADFEAPTFSNGVTQNADGTLNVPAGVTEFTITTPVKADNTTEGAEKGKFTVGGVEGNEFTVNDTSATPSDTTPPAAPTVTASTTDGSVVVTPPTDADTSKVDITYTDEGDQPQTVTVTKGNDGVWGIPQAAKDKGIIVDPATGEVTIPQDGVKDGSEVKATATDTSNNESPEGKGTAGTDSKNAGVDLSTDDNGASVGVVSTTPVDEGSNVVTTVKLTNNNGNESLPFSLPKGSNAGELSEADFEAPTFSNGVTQNPDGTLNVPAGVTEFTITTPVKADNTTEGAEKGKFTVGGVEGNEFTVNDTSETPADPADKPTITSQDNDGKVTIEPGADNNKVEVTFKDEDGNPKTVVAEKQPDGGWTVTNDDGTGATIVGDKVVIPADKVKDGEPVNAKGTNDAGNSADADSVNAGTDPKDAGVDNTNGDGVVSTTPTDEGQNVVTTVKLTNNNGNESLPFSLPKGTNPGELGEADFEAPTFSNGVTQNADGTLNVPAGVTEFTITTPVKADNTTEGAEKGKFSVGGVEGNEVTVNDTSKQDATPTIDINNIAGQAQVAEGTDGYAQFLPSNVTTEEISNTTENGVTTIVKGFTVSGTTTNVPDGTPVIVTILDSKGASYYSTHVEVTGGTWSIKVPVETTKTTVTGSGEDELTETQTVYHYPKFDTEYRVLATVNANGIEVTDEDKTESAPIVTDIYLQDTLTDDAPNVADFYTDTDRYVGRIDGMADTDATKAISRQTGLTNDPKAALHFTLDKALQSGQVVKVLRYTIVDGRESTVEDLTGQMTNNGLDYTVTPANPQSETTNTLYRYKVLVEDQNGVDLSEKAFTYRLDTIVEAMDVKELNADTNTMILQADGVSEIGATIKYKYHNGTGETALSDAVDNGDGTYTLNLANWNRKVAGSITIQVIDAAGNVSETKINAVRNLFTDYTAEKGPNPNGRNFDDANNALPGQTTGSKDEGVFVSTDGNDTLIVGLDNFGGMGSYNGSVSRTIGVGWTNKIEMGAGDDHIQVRGNMQSMGAAADGYFDMGEGNDKITFGGSFIIGNYNIRMGEGNNVINFSGTTVQALGADISFGDGNDVLRADVNKDFAGSKTISFGNGDNYMEVGAMHDANTITFGNGNDVFIAKSVGTKAPASGVIDMGDGNDTFSVSGLFARQEAKLGAGDDVAIMGDRIETGADYGRLDGGDGNDTLVLTKSNSKVSLQNVLNFEVIDLTVPTAQTIGISKDYITQANDTTKAIYIKGGTNDTVDFGDNGKYINGTKFKDGGGAIKANWNFWEKTESDVVHDGVTYDKYTYRAADGSVNDEAIYIQQGIQII
ncbi:hypothetical protein [Rodentibacter caecimuris]|uniref:hypothetical protein n=1 Tax=Rodentibacter caecimuris TaxID=1796644 RepID=UPI0013A09C7F|nr:hypothetical protein [Rodentibacter heylii]QIA77827.1 hypothetical protein FEE42_11025 [Rodentibacter heylii]